MGVGTLLAAVVALVLLLVAAQTLPPPTMVAAAVAITLANMLLAFLVISLLLQSNVNYASKLVIPLPPAISFTARALTLMRISCRLLLGCRLLNRQTPTTTPDTRATHHMTGDTHSLLSKTDYGGLI